MFLGGTAFPQIIGLASTFEPELAEKMSMAIRAQLMAVGARQTLAPGHARVPVTIVAASHDRLTPAVHARRMAERLGPDAELVVVPGAGHSVNLTRTAVVDQALLGLLDRVEADLGEPRRAG